jgi:ferric-dicitrate binding protein FerR (iron transport regulator)
MERPNERIAYLFIRHLKDELTVEEQLELREWVNVSEHNQAIFHQFTDPDNLNGALKEYSTLEASIWDKIDAKMKTADLSEEAPVYNIRPNKRRRWIYVAAAAVLLFLSITSYFWLASRFNLSSKARPASAPVGAKDVAPGGNKATLTLSNGSTIVLENAADGHLAEQGSSDISKQKNALSYTTTPANGATSAAVVYNTLTTPRAGQFQVILPDGTKVWLNNASSLRYPTTFSGATREVELTGEAYFEVAKNTSQPFSVKIPNAVIHVLGTSFNIMAYNDEPTVKATLLTGKVSIAAAAGKQTVLSPGEQGILTHAGEITMAKDVDTEEAIAWQRGYFHYVHANIGDVLRQLARWYDVEVIFTTPVSDDYTFDGEIGRDLNLSTILKYLEKNDLHFHIEGKKLIVTK